MNEEEEMVMMAGAILAVEIAAHEGTVSGALGRVEETQTCLRRVGEKSIVLDQAERLLTEANADDWRMAQHASAAEIEMAAT